MEWSNVTVKEVEQALGKTQNWKATGIDIISTSVSNLTLMTR